MRVSVFLFVPLSVSVCDTLCHVGGGQVLCMVVLLSLFLAVDLAGQFGFVVLVPASAFLCPV